MFGERVEALEEDEIEQAVEIMEIIKFLENAERGTDDEEENGDAEEQDEDEEEETEEEHEE